MCAGCSQSIKQNSINLDEVKPHMVTIPGGTFHMGSNERDDEQPIHEVTIDAFRLSDAEVTFSQWDACVVAGGCSYSPDDQGWGRGDRPVINVSYEDITTQFIPWLNRATGETYRLPSESEWEYAARAGSTRKYSWGDAIDCSKAHYGRAEATEGLRPAGQCSNTNDGTTIIRSFTPNSYGLYDMHGNAWELTEDCYHDSYEGAPRNGRAWVSDDCSFEHVLRGGAWFTTLVYLRSADRNGVAATQRDPLIGFRLAQGLDE